MAGVGSAAAAGVAYVFAVSAAAKAYRPALARDALIAIGVSAALARIGVFVAIVVEGGIAVALATRWAGMTLYLAAAALCLFLGADRLAKTRAVA